MSSDSFAVERVRHPVKARLLQITRITELSPSMRRLTLSGDDLQGFYSASFDDHLKLLLPAASGERPVVPSTGENGLVYAEGQIKPVMRDYTPRRYDADRNELDIDFVLHHAGPATDWASNAEVGHYIGIAGPRGSLIIPAHFDWHLLMGDETALPAIARRLEELPAASQALVVVKLRNENAKIELHSPASLSVRWVTQAADDKGGPEALAASLDELVLPSGEGFVWAAGEYSDIKALRQKLIDNFKIDKSRIRAASYWRKTEAASHTNFE